MSFLTGLLSGGISVAFLNHFLSNRREKNEFLRRRLEELYSHVEMYSNGFFLFNLPYMQAMQGKITINEALDLQIKNNVGNETKDFHKMEFIIAAYFPSMDSNYKEIRSIFRNVNKITTTYKKEYEKGNSVGKAYIPQISKEFDALDKATENLKNSIVSEARKLSNHSLLMDIKQSDLYRRYFQRQPN